MVSLVEDTFFRDGVALNVYVPSGGEVSHLLGGVHYFARVHILKERGSVAT